MCSKASRQVHPPVCLLRFAAKDAGSALLAWPGTCHCLFLVTGPWPKSTFGMVWNSHACDQDQFLTSFFYFVL